MESLVKEQATKRQPFLISAHLLKSGGTPQAQSSGSCEIQLRVLKVLWQKTSLPPSPKISCPSPGGFFLRQHCKVSAGVEDRGWMGTWHCYSGRVSLGCFCHVPLCDSTNHSPHQAPLPLWFSRQVSWVGLCAHLTGSSWFGIRDRACIGRWVSYH